MMGFINTETKLEFISEYFKWEITLNLDFSLYSELYSLLKLDLFNGTYVELNIDLNDEIDFDIWQE